MRARPNLLFTDPKYRSSYPECDIGRSSLCERVFIRDHKTILWGPLSNLRMIFSKQFSFLFIKPLRTSIAIPIHLSELCSLEFEQVQLEVDPLAFFEFDWTGQAVELQIGTY